MIKNNYFIANHCDRCTFWMLTLIAKFKMVQMPLYCKWYWGYTAFMPMIKVSRERLVR